MTASDKSPSRDEPAPSLSHSEWVAAAEDRYGENTMRWRFRCPVCGFDAEVADWKKAGAAEGTVAFSCIGRFLPGPVNKAFSKPQKSPCDYAGGGLFRLNPICVVASDGKEHRVFDFADRPLVSASTHKRRRA